MAVDEEHDYVNEHTGEGSDGGEPLEMLPGRYSPKMLEWH